MREKCCMKHISAMLEKFANEVVKHVDSSKYEIAFLQDKYGQNWEHVDRQARNVFNNCTISFIK